MLPPPIHPIRLLPLAADCTRIESAGALAPKLLALPGFDPGYALDFWVVNRQDWRACESVPRGLSSPHTPSRWPLARTRSQFVTMIARGLHGHPVWDPGAPVASG